MRHWDLPIKVAGLLAFIGQGISCNGSGVEYGYNLDQPINFVMTDSLYQGLDAQGRTLIGKAALHAAEALGTQGGWGHDLGHAGAESQSDNVTVQLTLGTVDCTGDRAGYVRWRPNNVLQVCPSMLKERSYLIMASLIMHEMGHVVGGNHVPCDGESIMAPDLNCPVKRYDRAASDPDALFWYSGRDLAELCQHAAGGICRSKQ